MPTASPAPSLSVHGWIVVVLGGALAAGFCIYLWPEWLHNPDLSHGLFAPVLFGLLLMESRRRGPWRYPADSIGWRVARGALLATGLGFVGLAGLYAAAIDWTHPLVSLALALALSALLLGALLWLATSRVRAVPLNWSSLVAVCIWPLCAPLPPGTYSRLTLQLQFWVTDFVLQALHLLGVAASTSGNIIMLAHTSVGVEEACSGVRSLLSCVVAAVFFSATLVTRPWARVFIIAIAPPLAFGMNIVRSLGLTLMANAGIDISGSWHDLTGFAVLGVTAAILGGIALWLEDKPAAYSTEAPDAKNASAPELAGLESSKTTPPAPRPWGLVSAYALAAAMVIFFVLNTHGPARKDSRIPDLAAILPIAPEGWDIVRTEDLYQFASVLKTEHLIQRSYVRNTGAAGMSEPLQITVYIAYWAPGKVPVSLVAAHTPEACWPGGGWTAQPVPPIRGPFLVRGDPVPTPEYRAFTNAGTLQNVWYWHLYDGRSIAQGDPRSAGALLKLAWDYGFRTAGEQLFVRVSSNRPWEEIRDDPLLAGIVDRLEPHGL
ncbi:MAG: exosortase/archaeosortase family protein [Rariglobus sp.]